MRDTGRYLLHLILALAGLLAADAVAHAAAAAGTGLLWQTILGAGGYTAATGAVGRLLLAVHPADAIADSITALAAVATGVIALAGLLLTGIGDLVNRPADTTAPDPDYGLTPEDAPDSGRDAYAKTA